MGMEDGFSRIGEVVVGSACDVIPDVGKGVGGSSASICSTCHDLFSSKNRIRSA
jgi:hypothetical protein